MKKGIVMFLFYCSTTIVIHAGKKECVIKKKNQENIPGIFQLLQQVKKQIDENVKSQDQLVTSLLTITDLLTHMIKITEESNNFLRELKNKEILSGMSASVVDFDNEFVSLLSDSEDEV